MLKMREIDFIDNQSIRKLHAINNYNMLKMREIDFIDNQLIKNTTYNKLKQLLHVLKFFAIATERDWIVDVPPQEAREQGGCRTSLQMVRANTREVPLLAVLCFSYCVWFPISCFTLLRHSSHYFM
jgi:hypothetical protein